MRTTIARLAAALWLVIGAATAAWAIELGEKAPELEVTDWAQGQPLKLADGAGKTVYVLEFLETIRPGCEKAFTAAVKLQEKYKGKGLEVVAISSESTDDVRKYLAEHPANFRFAIDEFLNTRVPYAGDEPELPYAVVIDKTGSVVFAGDPTEGMDKRIQDVMAGKFDLKRSLDVRKLQDELHEAVKAKEWDKADPLCDQILALDATELYAFHRRCDGFERRKELDGYRKFVKAYSDRVKDDAATLSALAWKLVEEDPCDYRDPELAVATARRSVELSKSTDADLLDTYAHVLSQAGLLEQAIVEERKAVALDAANETYKGRLAFLESCLATRKKVQPAGTPPKK